MNVGRGWRLVAMGAVVGGAVLLGGVAQQDEVAAGGGGCHGSPEKEGDGTRVALAGNCFSPIVLNVEPGETVVFENTDSVPHDITGAAGAWGSKGMLEGAGTSATITFTEPGLYPYSCYLHYGMTGVISVGDARSVSGWAPGEMTVSRVPVAPVGDDAPASVAEAEDGGFGGWWLAGGGALVGVVVATGAWVVRLRRS